MSEIIYSWNFSDKKDRGTFWYIIAFSIVIGLAVWGIFTKQYIFSFLIFLLSGVIFFVENNSDDEININITSLGIKVGDSFFDFSKINSYSFIYSGENAQLIRLYLNKKGLNKLDLKINNNICEDLKSILPNYVEESAKGELSFSEKLINILKL